MRYAYRPFLLVLLAGCASGAGALATGPKPGWVDDSASKYPDAQYFTGVGSVLNTDDPIATMKALDAAARIGLVKKIEVSVSSEFTAIQSETVNNGVSDSKQSVTDISREAVESIELDGVEIKERWLDEASGVAYAVAVWSKPRAQAILTAKLTEAEAASRKALDEGNKNAANPGVALMQYVAARSILEKARRYGVVLRAIKGEAIEVPDPSAVRAKLDALLSKVQLVVDEGDGQRVKPNTAAARPVVVRATIDGKPLSGAPIRFTMPGGTLDESVTTDASGLAKSHISNVGAITAEASVAAAIDWAGLAGEGDAAPAWLRGLKQGSTQARIVAASIESTRVLVAIVETVTEAPGTQIGEIQANLSSRFTAEGFQVRDAEALTARVPAEKLLTLDPKAFQKEARDLADIVVVGHAVSEHSSTLSGTVMTHRARLKLRVVDLGSGRVIATWNLEKKSPRPADGHKKAGSKALKALADAVDDSLPREVRVKLGL